MVNAEKTKLQSVEKCPKKIVINNINVLLSGECRNMGGKYKSFQIGIKSYMLTVANAGFTSDTIILATWIPTET